MKKLFEKLKNITYRDPGTGHAYLAYLTEEVGEVSTALCVKFGYKDKTVKESVEQECCDVIVTALAMIAKFNPDWTWKDVKDYMEEKINRWESRV